MTRLRQRIRFAMWVLGNLGFIRRVLWREFVQSATDIEWCRIAEEQLTHPVLVHPPSGDARLN